MCSYDDLLTFLTSRKNILDQYKLSTKNFYFVIIIPNVNYHISIFKDQWDNYETVSGKPYYLFHISSNNENARCSSYFWARKSDLKIKKIPPKYFKYNQYSYDFFASTRSQCSYVEIEKIILCFQNLLNLFKN